MLSKKVSIFVEKVDEKKKKNFVLAVTVFYVGNSCLAILTKISSFNNSTKFGKDCFSMQRFCEKKSTKINNNKI